MKKFLNLLQRVVLPLALVLVVWYLAGGVAGREGARENTSAVSAAVSASGVEEATQQPADTGAALREDGSYTSRDDVALYLHTYGRLPANFITKKAAQALGWDSKAGNLDEVAPGKSIGGDRFGNYEGLLPEKDGRKWYECDIGYEGGYRGAERILYSSDGLIYYTDDHYNSFTQLY